MRRNASIIALLFALLLIVLLSAYLLSPFSYLFVTFSEPLTATDYLDFLKDNGINPERHTVYVGGSVLSGYAGVYDLDMAGIKEGRALIQDTVFNTRPYAIKVLFDPRVKSWSIAGPRNPYD